MTVTVKLDKENYDTGETMTATVTEDYAGKRTFTISDSSGTSWTKVSGSDQGQGGTWTATAPTARIGENLLTFTMTPASGPVQTGSTSYSVGSQVPPKPLCLVGMSTPANKWAAEKAKVEAGGGKLQARRIFLRSLTDSLSLVQQALSEGQKPVVSFKVGNDWGGVASGKYDSQLKALSDNLAKLSKPIAVCLHHEPDTQSTPVDVGEGGSAQEFAGMYRRATPILKQAANVEVWPIMNGWWWTNAKAAFTDAQIAVWLPPDVRGLIDGVAADDYSPDGGEPGVVKTMNRVAWAKRMGDVKSLGIGETNAFVAKDLQDSFALASSEPLFRGGFALVWNSDSTEGMAMKPLSETGLMDEFQAIVRNWPR